MSDQPRCTTYHRHLPANWMDPNGEPRDLVASIIFRAQHLQAVEQIFMLWQPGGLQRCYLLLHGAPSYGLHDVDVAHLGVIMGCEMSVWLDVNALDRQVKGDAGMQWIEAFMPTIRAKLGVPEPARTIMVEARIENESLREAIEDLKKADREITDLRRLKSAVWELRGASPIEAGAVWKRVSAILDELGDDGEDF